MFGLDKPLSMEMYVQDEDKDGFCFSEEWVFHLLQGMSKIWDGAKTTLEKSRTVVASIFPVPGKKSRPWLFISPVQHFFEQNITTLKRYLKIDFFGPGNEHQNGQKWCWGNRYAPLKFVQPKTFILLPLNAKKSQILNFFHQFPFRF